MVRMKPAGIIATAVTAVTAVTAAAALTGADAGAAGAATAGTTACRAWTGHHPPYAVNLTSVAALSPCDIWAAGIPGVNPTASSPTDVLHWNGSTWTLITGATVPASLLPGPAIAATSSRDAWVVGSVTARTLIARSDGTSLTRVPSADPGAPPGFNGLAGVSALAGNSAWAAGLYSVFDPSTDTSVTRPLAERRNAGPWTQVPAAIPVTKFGHPTPYAEFSAVKALCGCYVWAVGAWAQQTSVNNERIETLIERWNGRSWTRLPTPNLSGDNWLTAVSADSKNDAWAVGYHGSPGQTVTEHWNGRSWKLVPSPSPGRLQGKANGLLYGVAAISPDNAWAAGFYASSPRGKQHALLLHWNGRTWRQINVPHYGPGYAPNVLLSVSASSAGNVIVGGSFSGPVGTGQQALVLRVG